jgi:S1-C subfamily serine protease
VALIVIVAVLSGMLSAAVTLAVLRLQSQSLDVGPRVTISEESVTIQVAGKAVPAVVTVVTQDGAANPSYGSGFLYTADGYVVTTTHVVARATSLSVLLNNDPKRHDARVIDFDCETGLAVLKVDRVSGLPTLAWGDSAALRLGQTLVAVGGPLEERAVTQGVVSALHRSVVVSDPVNPLRDQTLPDTLQTSALISPGTSGGPILNAASQVVALSVSTFSSGQRIGFGLTSLSVRSDLDQILQTGQLVVPMLGAKTTDLDGPAAALRDLPAGSFIDNVTPGSPADRAGLKQGDVITQLDENRIDPAHPLGQVLRLRFKPAQRTAVTYSRGGTSSQVQLVLGGGHPVCG